METLRKSNTSFAIDENDFVNVPNTKNLTIENTEDKKLNTKNSSYILYGNPTFYKDSLEKVNNKIVSLPGAESEIKLISDILNKNRKRSYIFLNNESDEAKLKLLKSPKVFHVATHGYFREAKKTNDIDENPLLNSGLLLTEAGDILKNENTFVNKHNGILTAFEAIDLNFDNTELVVLSACETGRGDIVVGEGVNGLQKAFFVAGTKAIILSLFKVDDDVTKDLMKCFYEDWLKTADYQQSFTKAKLYVKEKYQSPKLWGAFILVENQPKSNKN